MRKAIVVGLLLVAAQAFAQAPSKGVEKANELKTPVARWLVLGPVASPSPAFGEEKKGSFAVSELLQSAPLGRDAGLPEAGGKVSWLGGSELTWREVAADPAGLVSLTAPAGKGPAIAWLATNVRADRWQSLAVDLAGTQPRRLLLDGEQVASGGADKDKSDKPAEVKGKLKLPAGSHLLLVQTVFDPAQGGAWQAGVTLKSASAPPLSFSLASERDLDLLDGIDQPETGAMALAPDGTLVAFGMRRYHAGTDDNESWVEVRTSAGALRSSWRCGAEMRELAWAPSGHRLSYVTTDKSKGKDGKDAELSTLWLADLATGAVTPLVERVDGLGNVLWSPAGDAVVYSTTVKAEPDKRGIKLLESVLDRQRGHRDTNVLWLARVPSGVRVRLSAGGVSARVEDIAPDGSRVLVGRQLEDFAERPYTRTELWEIDLTTFAARKLRDFRWLDDVSYAPDGKRLLAVGGPSAFGAVGVNVPAGMTPNESDGQLYLWDPAADKVEPLSRDFDPAIANARFSRADGHVYLRAAIGDEVGVFRYRLAEKRFERLILGIPVVSSWTLAESAPVLAAAGTGPWQPRRLVVTDLGSGTTTTVVDPSASWLGKVRRGRLEEWSCTTAKGAPIPGRIYLPVGFEASKKYPVIVYYYAGTTPVTRDFAGRYPKEWWAARGYVVYVPEPSGATGYGQEHSARHVNEWGSLVVDEIIDATKQFLAAHPYADAAKVGCIGASYGGFTTMSLVAATDMFAAAVAHAGISSISSYWGEGYWGYSYNATSAAGSFPWNRPELYVKQSPLFRADKVKTPILLTHGTVDTNVPPGESETFFTALRMLGAPVEYLQIEGQNHAIMEHAKRIIWSRAIVAWFDRHLKGQPEWWNDMMAPPEKGK